MSDKQLYILQNQDKYFLGKDNQWVDGTDPKDLFKTTHRDIAINQLFEVNAHDVEQRIHVLECAVEGRNHPVIDPAIMPPPLPKPAPPEVDTDAELSTEDDMADDRYDAPGDDVEPAVEHEEELLVQ